MKQRRKWILQVGMRQENKAQEDMINLRVATLLLVRRTSFKTIWCLNTTQRGCGDEWDAPRANERRELLWKSEGVEADRVDDWICFMVHMR